MSAGAPVAIGPGGGRGIGGAAARELHARGYRRALLLINPVPQLGLVVDRAQRELRAWTRRARRAAPLFSLVHPRFAEEAGSVRCSGKNRSSRSPHHGLFPEHRTLNTEH